MSMGITETQRQAIGLIVNYVAINGAVPSLGTIAELMDCNKSNASRIVARLIERGQLSRMPDGSLALGGGGVFVNVPRDVASRLADFCQARGEQLSAVLTDAIVLHLDAVTGADPVEP